MKITDEAIETAIQSSGDEFDSHEIIRRVTQQNQRDYIADLTAAAGDAPFQTVHSMLGKRIRVICERHGFSGIASRSEDIFGQYGNCVLWSRRAAL